MLAQATSELNKLTDNHPIGENDHASRDGLEGAGLARGEHHGNPRRWQQSDVRRDRPIDEREHWQGDEKTCDMQSSHRVGRQLTDWTREIIAETDSIQRLSNGRGARRPDEERDHVEYRHPSISGREHGEIRPGARTFDGAAVRAQ